MKPTTPTPIMRADALAAVRFGLRIAFSGVDVEAEQIGRGRPPRIPEASI